MHIISVTDFPLFCSNSTRKCLILPAECSPQKSLILFEILPAECIQAYMWSIMMSLWRFPFANIAEVSKKIAEFACYLGLYA